MLKLPRAKTQKGFFEREARVVLFILNYGRPFSSGFC
jgi:hypothetical protein